jgi:hypothetical protein
MHEAVALLPVGIADDEATSPLSSSDELLREAIENSLLEPLERELALKASATSTVVAVATGGDAISASLLQKKLPVPAVVSKNARRSCFRCGAQTPARISLAFGRGSWLACEVCEAGTYCSSECRAAGAASHSAFCKPAEPMAAVPSSDYLSRAWRLAEEADELAEELIPAGEDSLMRWMPGMSSSVKRPRELRQQALDILHGPWAEEAFSYGGGSAHVPEEVSRLRLDLLAGVLLCDVFTAKTKPLRSHAAYGDPDRESLMMDVRATFSRPGQEMVLTTDDGFFAAAVCNAVLGLGREAVSLEDVPESSRWHEDAKAYLEVERSTNKPEGLAARKAREDREAGPGM